MKKIFFKILTFVKKILNLESVKDKKEYLEKQKKENNTDDIYPLW